MTATTVRQMPVFHARGFTLIEVLIALLIFGWIGIGAYQILDQVLIYQERQQTSSRALALRQRVAWQMGKDFRQMVARSITDEYGRRRAPFELESGEYIVEFTRAGWSNPLRWPRSELQRVAYRVDVHPDVNDTDSPHYGDEKLYLMRHYWSVLDRIESSIPNEQVLIGGVRDLEIRFYQVDAGQGARQGAAAAGSPALQGGGEWVSSPPPSKFSAKGHPLVAYGLPEKIEVTVVFEDDSLFSHVYNIR